MAIKIDASCLAVLRNRINSDELLKIIGNIAAAAVRENFEVGGRDEQGAVNIWKPSKRAEVEGGKTLVDTGKMKQSVSYELKGKNVVIGSKARSDGSQSPYYKKMFKKTGRPKPTSGVNYPANHQYGIGTIQREWLILPESVQQEIMQTVIEFLNKGSV